MSESNNINTKTLLYCVSNDKRNMWIYIIDNNLYVFDPILPNPESINIIAENMRENLYFVLTACQREKKQNLKLWQKIFNNIITLTPDRTFIKNEIVFQDETIIKFNEDTRIMNTKFFGTKHICMLIHQYLFLGEVSQPINSGFNFSEIIYEFCEYLNYTIIILPSTGPISILSELEIFNQKMKEFKEFQKQRIKKAKTSNVVTILF